MGRQPLDGVAHPLQFSDAGPSGQRAQTPAGARSGLGERDPRALVVDVRLRLRRAAPRRAAAPPRRARRRCPRRARRAGRESSRGRAAPRRSRTRATGSIFSCPLRYHSSPTASEASSGVCPGSTPKYPSAPGISTSSTCSWTSGRSGVTICRSMCVGWAIGYPFIFSAFSTASSIVPTM